MSFTPPRACTGARRGAPSPPWRASGNCRVRRRACCCGARCSEQQLMPRASHGWLVATLHRQLHASRQAASARDDGGSGRSRRSMRRTLRRYGVGALSPDAAQLNAARRRPRSTWACSASDRRWRRSACWYQMVAESHDGPLDAGRGRTRAGAQGAGRYLQRIGACRRRQRVSRRPSTCTATGRTSDRAGRRHRRREQRRR